jgi:hypothetical protein
LVARPVHPLKALHARIKLGLATPIKPHDNNPRRVNPRMFGEQFERPIGIEDYRQPAELRLIVSGVTLPYRSARRLRASG